MRNIRLVIEYDGTAYGGWQRQPNATSIQSSIEAAIAKVTGVRSRLTGSGRTDAGVHALGQVANFKTASDIPVERLAAALNAYLGEDIVVLSADAVGADFHSCRDALSKLYCYSVLNRRVRPALLRNSVFHVPVPLDVETMKECMSLLVGRRDFSSFQASGRPVKSPTRRILKSELLVDGDMLYFLIEGDGFLYKMVRNVVGTLLGAGKGKLDAAGFADVMQAHDRKRAGPTAPARGLCLLSVRYDGFSSGSNIPPTAGRVWRQRSCER